MVQRSRIHGNRAYVRIGVVNAGYRDLDTAAVHCEDHRYLAAVAQATAPLAFAAGHCAPSASPEPADPSALALAHA